MTVTANGIEELKGWSARPSARARREVTQEVIDQFADISRDHQWIHVDVERAKTESPFGTTVAHGNLTLSMIDGFRRSLMESSGFTMAVNYGWNKIRFPAPVPSGSRIRASTEVLSVDEIGGGWHQLVQRWTVEVEGSEKPALRGRIRRPTARVVTLKYNSPVKLSGVSSAPEQIADGLWRWTARHPEWHPGEFGREVASFAASANGDLVLIDPLLPSEPLAVLELIDELLHRRLAILISVPYHVRSSEELWRRYRDHARLQDLGTCGLREAPRRPGRLPRDRAGRALPTGVSAHAIGRPRRHETPLYIPSQRALAFGDAVAEVGGELRVWSNGKVDDRRARWYRDRFNPTLEPLLELDFDRVLVTHGRPVLADGHAQLRAALAARPWYRPG